jgi:hypothetical protein
MTKKKLLFLIGVLGFFANPLAAKLCYRFDTAYTFTWVLKKEVAVREG